ncbi:MAG: PaaI family thioesterase [Thermodesulfobacteriota bacterium]
MDNDNWPGEGFAPLPHRLRGNCFGCGPDNPVGLGMHFYSDGQTLASRLVVPEHLCGWGRVVHGGVVSTMLDELMGWTAITLLKRLVLTKSLAVEFRRPLFAGDPLRLRGRVEERRGEREALLSGEVLNPAGEVCAAATGIFALFTLEAARNLGFLDLELVEEVAVKYMGGTAV